MVELKKYIHIKIRYAIAVTFFLITGVSAAYPGHVDPGNSSLAVHSLFQQDPISRSDGARQEAFFLRSGLLLAATDIGNYLFGDPQHDIGPLPLRSMAEAISSSGLKLRGIPEHLELSAARTVTVRNGVLTAVPPEEKTASDSVIIVPYRTDSGDKYSMLIMLRGNPALQYFAGYELAVLDRYIVKIVKEAPDAYPAPAGDGAAKPRRQIPQGVSALIERVNSRNLGIDEAEKMFVESWDASWGRLIEFDRPRSFRSYFVFPDTTLRFIVDKNGKVRIKDINIPELQYRGDNVDLDAYRTDNLFIQEVIVDRSSKNIEFKFGVPRLGNAGIEAVGVLRPGQDSICASVATGCIGTPGCRFCGTGEKTVNREIHARGLTKDEIKDQVLLVSRFIRDTISADFGKEDLQLSLMGMGEPLLYPEATLGAIFELEKAGYITKSRISTTANVRLLKRMEEMVLGMFTPDVRPPMLQLSLQSPREDVRRSLVHNPDFISSVDELIAFAILYNRAAGILDRVDVRVSLMKGTNDSEEDARGLAMKIHDVCERECYKGDFHIKVTLINPCVPGFLPPDEAVMDSYVKAIRDLGFGNIFAFRTGGDPHDRSQADKVTCGTLVGKGKDIPGEPKIRILNGEKMLPPSMDFIVTDRCTEECKVCFAATQPPHKEASLEEQKRMIDRMYRYGVRRLIFTGGEPLLVKHIGALLKHAHDKGMATVLYTNGRLLDEKKAAEIMPYVDMISFPLDGYDEASNIHNGKMPGRFADTLRVLRLVGDKYPGKEIQILTIVTKQNRDYLEKIGDLLRDKARGIPSFHWKLSYYDRRGRTVVSFPDIANDPYYLSYDEYSGIVEPVQSRFQDIHARRSPRARDRAYLWMFPDGVLTTTEADRYIEFGNILSDATLTSDANRRVFSEIASHIKSRAIPIRRDADVTGPAQPFEIIGHHANNRRASIIEVANGFIRSVSEADHLQGQVAAQPPLDMRQTTAHILGRINDVLAAARHGGVEKLPETVVSQMDFVKRHIGNLEADSITASIIALARRAKKEDQKLIIGIATDWIPDYNDQRSFQHKATNQLIREIEDLPAILRSMGLDNTEIITDRSSEMLAAELKKRADLSKTKYSNVIAIASQEEITRQDGNVFRPLTSGEEKAFLAGIDPSELIKACEGDRGLTANQLDVDIMKILALTLEVAYGKEPPQSSWVTYDRDKRLLLLKLPPAKPIRYEELRDKRRGDVEALRAA